MNQGKIGVLLFCALFAQSGRAQPTNAKAPEPIPQFGTTGSTLFYDHEQWTVIHHTQATFAGIGLTDVVLLRAVLVTGSDGIGNPMHDVRVVAATRERVVANYGTPQRRRLEGTRPGLYVDAYLDIVDVTGDGIAEILFHSGYRGASDFATYEHILRYEPASNAFPI